MHTLCNVIRLSQQMQFLQKNWYKVNLALKAQHFNQVSDMRCIDDQCKKTTGWITKIEHPYLAQTSIILVCMNIVYYFVAKILNLHKKITAWIIIFYFILLLISDHQENEFLNLILTAAIKASHFTSYLWLLHIDWRIYHN